jgi:hypothetical protein
MNFIQDGKGRGYLTEVTSDNRLAVQGINDTSYQEASQTGLGFNVNTEFVSITVGTETPLFYFKNLETSDVVIAAWFIGIGVAGGSPTENALLRVYPNPTSVSGGVETIVVNRTIGSGKSFNFTTLKQSSGTPLTATLPTTPTLFQTQTASTRVFGEVYITVPRNNALIVTCQLNGAQTANIYTGFSGYLIA